MYTVSYEMDAVLSIPVIEVLELTFPLAKKCVCSCKGVALDTTLAHDLETMH